MQPVGTKIASLSETFDLIEKIENVNSKVIMISFTDFFVSNKYELKGIATNIDPVKQQ